MASGGEMEDCESPAVSVEGQEPESGPERKNSTDRSVPSSSGPFSTNSAFSIDELLKVKHTERDTEKLQECNEHQADPDMPEQTRTISKSPLSSLEETTRERPRGDESPVEERPRSHDAIVTPTPIPGVLATGSGLYPGYPPVAFSGMMPAQLGPMVDPTAAWLYPSWYRSQLFGLNGE